MYAKSQEEIENEYWYILFFYMFGGQVRTNTTGYTYFNHSVVVKNLRVLLYYFYTRVIKGCHKRRCVYFHGPHNRGKTTLLTCLAALMEKFTIININDDQPSQVAFGQATDSRVIGIDISRRGLTNLDNEHRNSLDGLLTQIERKHSDPKKIAICRLFW